MSVSITTVTVLGTARPWQFAAIAASAGAAETEVGYNANKQDGSAAGGTSGLNNTFTYGQRHGDVGETNPHTVAVSPGNMLTILYSSGTVVYKVGAGAVGPRGDNTGSAPVSPSIDWTDIDGYVYPSDCMPAASNLAKVAPADGRAGLCGCFTDSGGVIIAKTFWDWKSKGGTDTANSQISFIVPDGAAFLSMGIDDTILSDNTGNFVMSVTVWDVSSALRYTQSNPTLYFAGHYPVGYSCSANVADSAGVAPNVFITAVLTPLFDLSTKGLMKDYVGQLFPHGGQNSGGAPSGTNGQNFPY